MKKKATLSLWIKSSMKSLSEDANVGGKDKGKLSG